MPKDLGTTDLWNKDIYRIALEVAYAQLAKWELRLYVTEHESMLDNAIRVENDIAEIERWFGIMRRNRREYEYFRLTNKTAYQYAQQGLRRN